MRRYDRNGFSKQLEPASRHHVCSNPINCRDEQNVWINPQSTINIFKELNDLENRIIDLESSSQKTESLWGKTIVSAFTSSIINAVIGSWHIGL